MFVRIVREDGNTLMTYHGSRIIQRIREKQIEVEVSEGVFRELELDAGDKVFLMNDRGQTIDSITIER